MTYDVGQQVTLQATFKDVNGVLAATTASILVKSPDGVETTYSGAQLNNPSIGVYELTLVLTQPGVWLYKGLGTGAVKAAKAKRFTVNASPLDS